MSVFSGIKNKMKQKIRWVDWNVANAFEDGTIEMNKWLQLKEYSELRNKILSHENEHDSRKGFFYNLNVDLHSRIGFIELFKFMISRPKTWTQFLPVYWTKKRGVVYDPNIIFFWLFFDASFYFIIKILGGI